MTVKLLGPWGLQPAGTLYTTDATTEAAMVAAKVATSDLTGGVVYVPPGGPTSAAPGSGSVGLNVTQTISTTGIGASISIKSAPRISLTFGGMVGTVYQAQVQLENADTGAILALAYYPGSAPRWFDLPGGTSNVRFNTLYWSDIGGTSPVDSVQLTIAG
jgi:hypothetical protein